MTNESRPRAFLRSLAFAIALIGSAFLMGAHMSGSTTDGVSVVGQLAAQIVPGQAAPQQKFDGRKLYKAAFEALRDYHVTLADDAARNKFIADWEHKYDNTKDLDTEAGTDAAIAKMMESLGQRFDYFFGVEATQAEKDEVASQLVGIGATLRLKDQESIFKGLPNEVTRADVEKALTIRKGHELQVVEPLEGGPSDGVLKPGDVITHVRQDGEANATALDGMTMTDAIKKIKGAAGSSVELTIDRTGDDGKVSTIKVSIKRAVVKLKVVHTKDLGNGVTYIKLDNFMSATALDEMRAALVAAAKGKGVILDLRNNPGGELNSVINMAAHMIPEGTILITESREPAGAISEHQIIAQRDFTMQIEGQNVNIGGRPKVLLPETMPIVVLVNNGSASASEILSGALQAHHRALIVGKPTHGKGVGQTVIDLPFGRRMHVTNFEFLPGGKRMDWIGIIPDVDVDQDKADPKSDKQLDTAKAKIQEMIANAEALQKRSDELQKQNHDAFDKELKARDQKRSESLPRK